MVFAQIDNTLVTATLQTTAAPTTLPPGRSFVDITALPNQNILGWTYDGVNFIPPHDAVQLPTDLTRIVTKVGA